MASVIDSPARAPRVRRVNPVPAEGDDGVYTQSWFPICLSDELDVGRVIGRDFLGGRVAVFRDSAGVAHVMSAYCAHLGADLAVGEVVDDTLRCPFHHWQYDREGYCVKTAVGDAPPPGATLFKFPTIERFGMVLAFNGEQPLFDLPQLFPHQDDELVMATRRGLVIDCDGWVFSTNTPDMQHLKALHGVTFFHDYPHSLVNWHQWGFDYDFEGITGEDKGQAPLSWNLGILGSNIFFQMGTHTGRWYGVFIPFSCPKPQKSEVFMTIVTTKGDGSPAAIAAAEAFLDEMMAFEQTILNEDSPILNTIRYKPGTLTKSDRPLAKFLTYLRDYPRAHPSIDFIN